ncbi:exodeoxyribonuclease III [Swaminathania salitolerans]|uniref:Exodeoxyribonuclease III n=1 Tax=Swaminathania salitolerans TaxID=182838 RepID=A0A511BS78_9PROT|nr:exodeoxyribonuclease III [Swaminathania salitolerans]GBQ12792.1 exodeoxyribonuclease III [Swaminathania salitolerans LMG 21291]GEL03169.1 exodeoxyribonuclease III [Swaminathania salitolerans]
MSFTFASWNVNSIRQRERHVLDWLDRKKPDLLCLQELKCETALFPRSFADAGYHPVVVGQKAYNGVAMLSRDPVELRCDKLPGFAHDAARYVEIGVAGMVIGNLYLPNGNSGGATGFATKRAFLDALAGRARSLLDEEEDFLFTGDFNVCPTDEDYAPGALSPDDALLRPESRAGWRRLLWLGLTDALRAVAPSGRHYTYYDYQNAAFQRNAGLRIDHALLSPRLAERLVSVTPDRDERAKEQPSDHVPLVVTLS